MSLLNLYYYIGKVLYDNSVWGNKFLEKLAIDYMKNLPTKEDLSMHVDINE